MPLLTEILKSKIGKGGKSKAYVASQMGTSEKTIENYMNGKREPKHAGLVRLAEVVGFSLSELSEQNVPRGAERSKNAPINDSKAIYTHDSETAPLSGLIEINRNLSAAQRQAEENRNLAEQRAKIDAECRKELVHQNEQLTQMLQQSNSTVQKEIEQARLVVLSLVLEQVARIGVKAGFYKSLEQAADILNIPLGHFAENVTNRKQTFRSVNKKA